MTKNYYPDITTINSLNKNVTAALEKIQTTFVQNETDLNKQAVIKTALYGLDSLAGDLNKYLMAGFVIEKPQDPAMLEEYLKALKESLKNKKKKNGSSSLF